MAEPVAFPQVWQLISDELRSSMSAVNYAMWFASATPTEQDPDGSWTVAVPNEFTLGWIMNHHRADVDQAARRHGVGPIKFVVDPTSGPPQLMEASKLDLADATTLVDRRSATPGVIARLLGERGFWSLSPGSQSDVFEIGDLHGRLQVIPSALGTCGMFESIVFTGLLSVWADGPRSEPAVKTSAKQLADLLELSWYGDLGDRLRRAIELLKATTYRLEVTDPDGGGWTDAFSLLDRAQTNWSGARSSPQRRMRAVFSEAVWEQITQRRMIRPVDLVALRAIGEQRDVARRLFLFLEASPAPIRLPYGREGIERIIDDRLAGTLGVKSDPRLLRQQLIRASEPIIDASPRYEAIDIAPREKRGLKRGDPKHVLRVVRARIAPTRKP